MKRDKTPLIELRASQQRNVIKVYHENVLLMNEYLICSSEMPDPNLPQTGVRGSMPYESLLHLEIDSSASPLII